MHTQIRRMQACDRAQVLQMMRVFYASPYVSTDGSETIFETDIDQCLGGSPYLEGFVFVDANGLCGYAMIAKSFSTEFGKPCIWIEDLYIREPFCGKGLGSRFLQFITERYPDALLRLEVEKENERAVHVYQKHGFDFLPYLEMKKECRPIGVEQPGCPAHLGD